MRSRKGRQQKQRLRRRKGVSASTHYARGASNDEREKPKRHTCGAHATCAR